MASKLALVTGGAGTIGKAIAKALLSANISVVLTGRRLAKLEEVKETLLAGRSSSVDASVYAISSDISKEESVVQLFQEISALENGSGSVDILVNNAGINSSVNSVDELSAAEMEKVLGVNVVGAFLCAREAMKQMKQKSDDTGSGGKGRIINVGSISAFSPRPNSTAYTTSKFAIAGLSQSLALDGREHKIAVGTIHPGNVVSDLLTPEEVEKRGATEGFLQPEDVAQCVLTMATLPYTVNVLDLTVIPTSQPFIGRG
eukprot:CAMPEP_0116140354 /NCGR_PEP_ID=MMETSP0329-20121206/13797_1 /TAXON_ID=697910 /ORGANISM="Pseudo-nitzschia arenysensis, Strain B593" /LENGTH=258 /DNA_ID=CAMNT_0003635451 /DNA_START=57 /DNA_END=833 /DNA_ORIENTATION=-